MLVFWKDKFYGANFDVFFLLFNSKSWLLNVWPLLNCWYLLSDFFLYHHFIFLYLTMRRVTYFVLPFWLTDKADRQIGEQFKMEGKEMDWKELRFKDMRFKSSPLVIRPIHNKQSTSNATNSQQAVH